MVKRHSPGLGNYWDDLLKKAQDEAKRLAQQAQQAAQQVYQQGQQVGQQVQQGVQSGMQYVTHLQLPASVRNTPAGQWITQHAGPDAIKAAMNKLKSPLTKAVAHLSIGNIPGAVLVVKNNKDQVMSELPPFARNFLININREIGNMFDGRPSSLDGLDTYGGGKQFFGDSPFNDLGDIGSLEGTLANIAKSVQTWWKGLDSYAKATVISILIITIILVVIACVYTGGLGAFFSVKGGAWAIAKATAGYIYGVMQTLATAIWALFLKDPATPTDVTLAQSPVSQNPPPPPGGDPTKAVHAAMTGSDSSAMIGMGLAAAAILLFPIRVRK